MSEPNKQGMIVARRYAKWYIGDRYWADQIIRAYLNPEVVEDELDEAMGDS